MLKEVIEKLVEIAQPLILNVEEKTFSVNSKGEASEIRPVIDTAECLTLTSLDSLVKMVKTEALNLYQAPLYITIPGHTEVTCFAQPDSNKRCLRQFFYCAQATDVPGWNADTKMGFEEAMIAMRTRFQDTGDAMYALKLLSDITTGSKVTYSDNGIATSVVTKTGVALQTNEAIRPIVTLKPYRTFQEIDQPASQFLIRVTERGINFIESDGGMWKLTARKTIKEYLDEALASEIEAGRVVVTL